MDKYRGYPLCENIRHSKRMNRGEMKDKIKAPKIMVRNFPKSVVKVTQPIRSRTWSRLKFSREHSAFGAIKSPIVVAEGYFYFR